MPKSVFTGAHKILVETLIAARRDAGLLQEDVARRLGKNQSYISNIERGQRRVDVLEFVALARAMSTDPIKLFTAMAKRLPPNFEV